MQEEEIIARYGIDIEKIKQEQIKLAKTLVLKDSIDFSQTERIAAIENLIIQNRIISAIVVCDKKNNIIEQQYFVDKLRFPYLHEFRSYREVGPMVEVFAKLQERPDVVLIRGNGITHPRLGLASHFSILTGVPTIGVSDFLFEGDKIDGMDIVKGAKKVGKVIIGKEGSNPLYISPGNKISINTANEIIKKFIILPHKFPEPNHIAHKYAREVREELKI